MNRRGLCFAMGDGWDDDRRTIEEVLDLLSSLERNSEASSRLGKPSLGS